MSLSHGETNSVGETLAKRTSGDLNTGGVVSLGVTGGDAVELLPKMSKNVAVYMARRDLHGSSSGHQW